VGSLVGVFEGLLSGHFGFLEGVFDGCLLSGHFVGMAVFLVVGLEVVVGMDATGAPVGFAESGLFVGMAVTDLALGFAVVGVFVG
jgi:hypothetical protein